MKRILIALILVLSLVICLPSCKPEVNIEENPDFATYNEMLNKDFDNYTIDISITSANGDTVNEKYIVTTSDGMRSVTYRIERINQFTVNGDEITIPDGYVSVEEGTYDSNDSLAAKFNVPKFNFSYTCLSDSDVTIGNTYSTAVTSLEKFMGLTISATNGSVKLNFDDGAAKSIAVSYVTELENTVIITYTFN